ncbi:hypothetical protein OROGR_029469 [Orobanche gracilis]
MTQQEIELQKIMDDLINTQMYNSIGILIALIFMTVELGSSFPQPLLINGILNGGCYIVGSHPSKIMSVSIRLQKDHPKMIISWLLRTN